MRSNEWRDNHFYLLQNTLSSKFSRSYIYTTLFGYLPRHIWIYIFKLWLTEYYHCRYFPSCIVFGEWKLLRKIVVLPTSKKYNFSQGVLGDFNMLRKRGRTLGNQTQTFVGVARYSSDRSQHYKSLTMFEDYIGFSPKI